MNWFIPAVGRRGRTWRTIRPMAVTSLVLGLTAAVPQSAATAADPVPQPETAALLDAGRDYLQNRADLVTTSHSTARSAGASVAMTAPMAADARQEEAALTERGALLQAVNGDTVRPRSP